MSLRLLLRRWFPPKPRQSIRLDFGEIAKEVTSDAAIMRWVDGLAGGSAGAPSIYVRETLTGSESLWPNLDHTGPPGIWPNQTLSVPPARVQVFGKAPEGAPSGPELGHGRD